MHRCQQGQVSTQKMEKLDKKNERKQALPEN